MTNLARCIATEIILTTFLGDSLKNKKINGSENLIEELNLMMADRSIISNTLKFKVLSRLIDTDYKNLDFLMDEREKRTKNRWN